MKILTLAHNVPDEITSAARDRGFRVVKMMPMASLPTPVASHPDMLFFRDDGRIFVRSCHYEDERFSSLIDEIASLGGYTVSLTSDPAVDTYPGDVVFNCVMFGGILAGRADSISGAVKRFASERMIPTLDVRQGYAKCSTCVVGDRGIITADKSIHKSALENGVDSLLIRPGYVSLPGYDTGFIGGASFFDDGVLYFLGDVSHHPDFDKISGAAARFGVDVVSLGGCELFDAGCLIL